MKFSLLEKWLVRGSRMVCFVHFMNICQVSLLVDAVEN